MTAVRVVFVPEDGEPIAVSANLTVRIVPAEPSDADPQCFLLDPPALSEGEDREAADGGELTFMRDESMSYELPPRTRRFLVSRWPDGLTKVREVPIGEAEQ